MSKSNRSPRAETSSNPEEDKFWISIGQSLVSHTIDVFDTRAQFMITTSASLLVVDFAALLITSKIALLKVSPQFLFAVSALSFMYSLFPKQFAVNPWTPDETKLTYDKIIHRKHRAHVLGFCLFFIGLVLVAITSLI